MYYIKVLDGKMRSCNGGSMQWELGKKVTILGKIQLCTRGIHLTLIPDQWEGLRWFIAETSNIAESDDDKVVCREATLIMEIMNKKAYREAIATANKAYDEAIQKYLASLVGTK